MENTGDLGGEKVFLIRSKLAKNCKWNDKILNKLGKKLRNKIFLASKYYPSYK